MNRRVLVVDDNPDVSDDFRKILGQSSAVSQEMHALEAGLFGTDQAEPRTEFELDFANQGEEAVRRVVKSVADDKPYAVVFMDVRMPPGWDGVKTTRHVLSEDPHVAVVICTAYADYNWEQMAKVFGETDRVLVLKKPFDPVEVRQLAHALHRKWELARAADFKLEKLDFMVSERARALSSALDDLKREKEIRQRVESELRLSQKLESVGQLAAGIAHEINTPLQYIGDHVDFLVGAFDDLRGLIGNYRIECGSANEQQALAIYEKLRRYEERIDAAYVEGQIPKALEHAMHGIKRITHIVRAMKEFSYPDRDDKKPADLNHVIRNALTVSRNEYKHMVELETQFGNLPAVECRAGEIGQVLLNLIVNAADAMKESGGRGTLKIKTSLEDEDTVLITVGDDGCGIPSSIHERIFDPFFTTKEVGRGTGQGLTIAHTVIVDGHRGTLTFDTTEGKGTTFSVRIPVHDPGPRTTPT